MSESSKIEVEISAEARRLLTTLARHGLFGESPTAVASNLLRERLRDVIREGWIGRVNLQGSSETKPIVRER